MPFPLKALYNYYHRQDASCSKVVFGTTWVFWVELCPPQKSCIEVLTSLRTSECDRMWREVFKEIIKLK